MGRAGGLALTLLLFAFADVPVALIVWIVGLPTELVPAFAALAITGLAGMSLYLAVSIVVGLAEPVLLLRIVQERVPARLRRSRPASVG